MRFREITAITGMGGLFKMESQKASGLIVTSLSEGWTKFVSNREHLFSPLDNIAIYTNEDTMPLLDVMLKAYEQRDSNPPVDPKADNATISAWFEKILPEYDREKVYINDIKKFIKWFHILDAQGVLQTEADEMEKEKSEASSTEKTEE